MGKGRRGYVRLLIGLAVLIPLGGLQLVVLQSPGSQFLFLGLTSHRLTLSDADSDVWDSATTGFDSLQRLVPRNVPASQS
jgi:hypothetical protein